MEISKGAKIKRGEIRCFAPRGAKIRWAKNELSENLREAKIEKNKVCRCDSGVSTRVKTTDSASCCSTQYHMNNLRK